MEITWAKRVIIESKREVEAVRFETGNVYITFSKEFPCVNCKESNVLVRHGALGAGNPHPVPMCQRCMNLIYEKAKYTPEEIEAKQKIQRDQLEAKAFLLKAQKEEYKQQHKAKKMDFAAQKRFIEEEKLKLPLQPKQ